MKINQGNLKAAGMALNIQNGGVFYSLRMLTEWQPFYRQYQQLFVVKS